MLVETSSNETNYSINFSFRINVEAINEDEAIEKAKSQLFELIQTAHTLDEYLSIESIIRTDTYHESYVDDWDFDDVW